MTVYTKCKLSGSAPQLSARLGRLARELPLRGRLLMAALLLICMTVTLGTAASAQKAAPKLSQPDVLVLIFAIPGGPDQIGLTYRNTVPNSQAQRDIQAIQTATGWKVAGIHIADMLPPIANSKQKMTSADFVAQGAVDPNAKFLPIQPLVEALRNYHHVAVTFIINYPFTFEGLRHYADNHVNIALEQNGSGYTYQINYRDSRLDSLNLPRYQPAEASASTIKSSQRKDRVNPWLVALVGVAAIGAGLIVYTVFARNT